MPKPGFFAILALAGALPLASVAAFAQSVTPPPYAVPGTGPNGAPPPPPPGARPHRRSPLQRALAGLALTPGQRARIHTYMAAYRQSRASATPETRAQLIAQIEGVLTPGERTAFVARLQRARHRLASRGAQPYGASRPQANSAPERPAAEPAPNDEGPGSSEPASGPSTPP